MSTEIRTKTDAVESEAVEKTCWQCGETFSTDLDYCPVDGARLVEVEVEQDDPLIGSLFDGRYRILSQLGEGGMSTVYAARQVDFERRVAIKILKADYLRDENIRRRFMYEARIIAELHHPNAVRLFDFGQAPDQSFYMVMELLEGESLADRLARRFLTYREVFNIVPPICGVLGEAHKKDVIHRDLKPENIFLLRVEGGDREFAKLLDFGIAKHLRSDRMTKSGALWGTPAYMSPEQARGETVGGHADIYAIGLILYELICGNLPFQASTNMGYAIKHMHEEARPLHTLPGLTSVPEVLDELILSALHKDVEPRPQSMEELAEALLSIREEHFDEEILDSVPAEEIDPVALQEWLRNEGGEATTDEDVPSDTVASPPPPLADSKRTTSHTPQLEVEANTFRSGVDESQDEEPTDTSGERLEQPTREVGDDDALPIKRTNLEDYADLPDERRSAASEAATAPLDERLEEDEPTAVSSQSGRRMVAAGIALVVVAALIFIASNFGTSPSGSSTGGDATSTGALSGTVGGAASPGEPARASSAAGGGPAAGTAAGQGASLATSTVFRAREAALMIKHDVDDLGELFGEQELRRRRDRQRRRIREPAPKERSSEQRKTREAIRGTF